MKWKSIAGVLLLAGIAVLSGCGGGGGGTSSGPTSTTAVVSLTVTNTQPLPAQINGIHIEFNLPAGVSVATDSANPNQISSTALVAGSALDAIPAADKLVLGSYTANTRLVSISVSGTSGFSPGEYARLTCVAAPGVTLGQSAIAALTYANFSAYYVLGANTTVNITSDLSPGFALK
ncbi:MAG TPA: hypothetical protein VFG19_08515 [Geobacteraceae bacterium]|nr:hypothetical protein [Geobacteraceae bacterium]